MLDAITSFFKTNGFMPHGMCLLWRPDLLWTMVISNLIIAFSYFLITATLIYLVVKRNDIRFRLIFILFGAFIFACGGTHLIDAITFWYPIYSIQSIVLALTALVSFFTAIFLLPLVPQLLKIPSPWTLEEANKELRNTNLALQKVEDDLLATNKKLENANRAKDTFLSNMSHELRTPLNAIIGFTGTLLMKLPGPINNNQEKQLKTIQNSSRQLLALINDILDLANIESGKIELNFTMVDCNEVLKNVLAMQKSQAEMQEITLRVKIPDQPIATKTDKRCLTQILVNLTNNAIKFTEKGFVEVELTTQQIDQQQFVVIRVEDTGSGIKKSDQEKIFQAFEKINIPGRLLKGPGLGLHLVKRLTDLLHGQIEFDSEIGKGTIFKLFIPLVVDSSDVQEKENAEIEN